MLINVKPILNASTKVIMIMGLMMAASGGLAASGNAAEDAPQIQWVGDLPISPALKIEPGLGFAFDSPEGRVVMIYLSGEISADEIMAYYRQALPPLGWNETAEMRWAREGEALLIHPTTAAGTPLWKIMLRPE